jgi:hypothetical protein
MKKDIQRKRKPNSTMEGDIESRMRGRDRSLSYYDHHRPRRSLLTAPFCLMNAIPFGMYGRYFVSRYILGELGHNVVQLWLLSKKSIHRLRQNSSQPFWEIGGTHNVPMECTWIAPVYLTPSEGCASPLAKPSLP